MHARILRLAALAVVALVVALPMSADAAAKKKHKTVHFTAVGDGSRLDTTTATYEIQATPGGAGAAVQKVTSLTSTAGTDTTYAYYTNGSTVGKDTFTLSAPDANGIVHISGSGHFTSGTGIYKGIKALRAPGTMSCASPDTVHMTCTMRDKVLAPPTA